MNNVGCGIVALALLATFPNVALGQKEKQMPQQFMGMRSGGLLGWWRRRQKIA
jgi:hypothetical protein